MSVEDEQRSISAKEAQPAAHFEVDVRTSCGGFARLPSVARTSLRISSHRPPTPVDLAHGAAEGAGQQAKRNREGGGHPPLGPAPQALGASIRPASSFGNIALRHTYLRTPTISVAPYTGAVDHVSRSPTNEGQAEQTQSKQHEGGRLRYIPRTTTARDRNQSGFAGSRTARVAIDGVDDEVSRPITA
jgi:hypothetical protein